MPQSLARNTIHLIFSTKHREPLIAPALDRRLFAYMAGTLNDIKCPALMIGGVADHVHVMFVLARTVSLSDAVETVKKSSSKWMKLNGVPRFYWQGGYGAFSVSHSHVSRVAAYIAAQEEHHRKKTFGQEFEVLVKKYGLEWRED